MSRTVEDLVLEMADGLARLSWTLAKTRWAANRKLSRIERRRRL